MLFLFFSIVHKLYHLAKIFDLKKKIIEMLMDYSYVKTSKLKLLCKQIRTCLRLHIGK